MEGPVARVVGEDGELEIRAEAGTFAAERLEEACKANKKKGVLTRLTVTLPGGIVHPSPFQHEVQGRKIADLSSHLFGLAKCLSSG